MGGGLKHGNSTEGNLVGHCLQEHWGPQTNGQRLAKQCRPSQGGTGLSCLSLLPGTIWGFPKKGGPRKEGLSGSLLLPGTIWGFPEKEWPTNVRMARLFSAPVQPAG